MGGENGRMFDRFFFCVRSIWSVRALRERERARERASFAWQALLFVCRSRPSSKEANGRRVAARQRQRVLKWKQAHLPTGSRARASACATKKFVATK